MKGLDQGGAPYSASDFGVPLASPLSGMDCPVGKEGPFEQVGEGNKSPIVAPPSALSMASPSRDRDSRMVLQVDAISEMDCHSSSRVSLPASDMTGHKKVGSARKAQAGLPLPASCPILHLAPDSLLLMEFRRDKVRGKKEALSSGAGSPLSSLPPGLAGPS